MTDVSRLMYFLHKYNCMMSDGYIILYILMISNI